MNRVLSVSLLLIAFVVLCCDCCSVIQNSHPNGRQLAAQEADETVALILPNGEDHHVYCTGTWVSNSVLMTAAHCILGATRMVNERNSDAATEDGMFPIISPLDMTIQFALASEITEVGKPVAALHSATVRELLKGSDVALLDVVKPMSITNHSVVRVAEKAPEQGDELSFMGHPDGFYFSWFRGYVASIRSDLKYVPIMGPFIQVSAPIYKGNSGGCAFNSAGECVGIASFMNNGAPDMGFYVHTDTLLGILRGAQILPITIDTTQPDPELNGKSRE